MRLSFYPIAACAALFVISPAIAQQTSYPSAETVRITDFIGTINVETVRDGEVTLNRSNGTDPSYPNYVEESGGVLTIYSDQDPDKTKWRDDVNWRKYHENAFKVFLTSYPTMSLRVPAGTALEFDRAVVQLTADSTKGAFSVTGGYVEGEVGDIASANVKIHGSADLNTGAVAGDLKIYIYGSGDFTAKTASSLYADIHGSGDISVSDIAGDSASDIHGSGDIIIGKIGGDFTASIQGSGDIDTGTISGGAKLSINGSGDITLASINGQSSATVHGSGDIDIADGRAENLQVSMSGSGGFEFGGVATNPTIRATRSSDVYIRAHEGVIRASGDGEIQISGVDYGDEN